MSLSFSVHCSLPAFLYIVHVKIYILVLYFTILLKFISINIISLQQLKSFKFVVHHKKESTGVCCFPVVMFQSPFIMPRLVWGPSYLTYLWSHGARPIIITYMGCVIIIVSKATIQLTLFKINIYPTSCISNDPESVQYWCSSIQMIGWFLGS